MPARSNEFQRLIYLLKKQFAGAATVVESRLLPDRSTGGVREVDVCIETTVAEHMVLVCIECSSTKRPATVEWVDQMTAKHRRLPTSLLVLTSRSGFSQEATKAAEREGHQILSFEEIEGGGLESIRDPRSCLWAKLIELRVSKVIAVTAPTPRFPSERVRLLPENNIVKPNGDYLGMTGELVQGILQNPIAVEMLARDGTEEHVGYQLEIPRPQVGGGPVCLQKIEPRVVQEIERLEIQGGCRFFVSEFRMRQARIGGISVSWGSAPLKDKSAMVVVSPAGADQPKLTLDLRSSSEEST